MNKLSRTQLRRLWSYGLLAFMLGVLVAAAMHASAPEHRLPLVLVIVVAFLIGTLVGAHVMEEGE